MNENTFVIKNNGGRLEAYRTKDGEMLAYTLGEGDEHKTAIVNTLGERGWSLKEEKEGQNT